ncbi:FAD-dependent oxidoreductase [Deinococcus taeanensis]|uniref:phytoene desaturase family protein n=1 Tax=Deinococcus taeanensis TaxID=2737050 RepID=UPI001CDC1B43|nr:FAD-dependent oxidoreductase [Deinococcus taeanensis]UBV43541.1 FAD-dependent oxidoreductase [Deinococcus taeanensis]
MPRSVGILGGGLAGLTLAALLAQRGHAVTVYERDRAGGKLRRVPLAGATMATGPSLFTFPAVWRAFLRHLNEPDPLNLQLLPGGLGVHHTPHGPVPLPVPAGHPLHPYWQQYVAAAAPVAPFMPVLLTTPPRLRDPLFRQAAGALLRVTGGHLSAHGWLRAQRLPPALTHALATHALNAGLSPQDAPALYALIPALVAETVCAPAPGMGALLDALLSFAAARGVTVLEGATVQRVEGQTLHFSGARPVRHDLIVSALDPARLRALLGFPAPSPLRRRTVSGVGVYAAFPSPLALPATSVLPPTDFRVFRAAVRRGHLPPDTLTLVHARGPHLSVLMATPATGQALPLTHPWVQGQLARAEQTLEAPGLLARATDIASLSPAHYAAGGHPGGALYGLGLPAWRGGPLHPQPYQVRPGLWQVGTGVHPGGGLPAILGGALNVNRLLSETGV